MGASNLLDSREASEEDNSQYQGNLKRYCKEKLDIIFPSDIERIFDSVENNAVTIVKSANAVGKTYLAGHLSVSFYKVYPESQVYCAAAPPLQNLERIFWSIVASIPEKLPKLFKNDILRHLHISRNSRSHITGQPIPTSGSDSQREAKFSGKHSPYLLFVIDEGDAVPDEVYRGIESCMSGGHARLLIMFNPRAEARWVYRAERDRKANVITLSAFTHPNVVTGEDKIPGAVTREVTVRRINEWCRPLAEDEKPNAECFELPYFLEGAIAKSQASIDYPPLQPGYYKIMEPSFSYMVLGQYPAKGSNQLISRDWIEKARNRWEEHIAVYGEKPPQYTSAIMGLDVGEFGTDSNVACFRYRGYVETLVSWGDIDTVETAQRAITEYHKRNVARAAVDATGTGSGVAPFMQKQGGCCANPVKVASSPTYSTELGEFQILRDQLWWSCREWLRADPAAMLPPDDQLIEELLTLTYEVTNGKIRVMKKSTIRELIKRSCDRADALCLTFYQGGYFSDCDLT